MVKREKIRLFLSARAMRPAMISPAMEIIEPLFLHAEAGKYALASAAGVSCQEALELLAGANGRPVKRIVAMSASKPFPQPDWMTEAGYRDVIQGIFRPGIRASHDASLPDSFWNRDFPLCLGDSHWDDLRNRHGSVFADVFWESLWDDFWYDLRAGFRASLGDFLVDVLWGDLQRVLFHFFGFVLAGDEKQMMRLAPLVRLLPQAIPVGEKADEPGAWLVLFV